MISQFYIKISKGEPICLISKNEAVSELGKGDFREVERCDGRLGDATAVSYRRQHIPELFNPR